MFDDVAEADDAGVVAVMAAANRDEAVAAARRFAAIAELVARHAVGATDCGRWSCDNWDAIAAQVGAALNISHNLASHQMYQALALRQRLPAVATLFAEGRLSLRLVTTIIWHTELIKDPAVLRVVDALLANDALRYAPLSQPKTARAIDALIERYDPPRFGAPALARGLVRWSSPPPMTARGPPRYGARCWAPMPRCWIAGCQIWPARYVTPIRGRWPSAVPML